MMTRREQIQRFEDAFQAFLEHWGKEFDITGIEVVGVLQAKVVMISNNINNPRPPKQKPQ